MLAGNYIGVMNVAVVVDSVVWVGTTVLLKLKGICFVNKLYLWLTINKGE